MKKMKIMKQISAVIVSLIMIMNSVSVPALAAAPVPMTDETAYVTLDYYGQMGEVSVVKGVDLNGNSQIMDYGQYSRITNMTTLDKPKIDGNHLVWNLDEKTAPKRFYYEVVPQDNNLEIPWNIDVNYKLNGVPIKAERLAGASGLVAIDVVVTPNTKVSNYYKNNFILMVGTMINGDKYYSFNAPGSQLISLGSAQAAFFVALPKQSKTFHFEIGTDSFETDGLMMVMTPATLEQLDAVKDIKAHKDNIENAGSAIDATLGDILDIMGGMKNGMQATVDGLNKLNDVRQSISDKGNDNLNNINQTKDSLNTLQSRLNSYNDIIGMTPYAATASAMGINSGLSESANLLGNLSNTLGSVSNTINDSGDKLNDGTKLSLNGMTTLLGDMNKTLDKTEDLKKNKTVISSIIRDEWNRFDKDMGILDIDTKATKPSFTSNKNPAPRSIQIVLRTQDIKVDKNAKLAALEEEKDKLGVLGRVKLVFTTIYETIKTNF